MRVTLTLLFFFLASTRLFAQLVSAEPQTIKINLGWSHQFQFAGYYAALEQGYFLEEGLDVELISEIRQDNIGSVIDGTYQYGIATGGTILQDHRFDNITAVAAIYQQSPVSLLTLKAGNISTLKDIEGTDIIGGTEIKSLLVSAGVDISKVNFHGTVGSFSGLINGDFDATSFFVTDQAMFIGADSVKFKIWRPIEYGINFYGECLLTSRAEAKSHPDRVEKLRHAVIRGWQYTVDHPEEMIDLITAKYNPRLDKSTLRGEANIIIHTLILPKFHDIGDMQLSKWSEMAKIIYDFGLIDKPRNLTGFIFEAEPQLARPLKILVWVSFLIIALAAGFLFVLFLYNNQLRKAVKSRTESLEKANEEMDRFVYSISHDIRSPLSSVQGIINLMKIEKEDHEKYLGLIESSIKKLDNYTRDILDYTRNSRAKLESKAVNIQEIIAKCIDQVKYADSTSQIEFIMNVSEEDTFVTDAWRLEVILTNLISNAIKYQEPDRKNPIVKITFSSSNGNMVFVIEDNGMGIKAEHLSKIYNMFYRASEDSQGSGMGLYIVKETVSMLSGTVSIASKVGKGTKVEVSIPENPSSN